MYKLLRKIAIISIPTAGHIKSLLGLAKIIKSYDKKTFITFILTSWEGYIINATDEKKLQEIGDQLIIFKTPSYIKKQDTYGRALVLSDEIIKICRNHDNIIYDFMTPEGYVAGCVLSLPSICINPSFINKCNKHSNDFIKQINFNINKIKKLEKKYQINVIQHLQLFSNQLSIQAPINIILSWKKFIGNYNFTNQSKEYEYIFMRPMDNTTQNKEDTYSYLNDIKKSGKKIIYFSLGTIAPGPAWEMTNNSLKCFIKKIYEYLFSIAFRRNDLFFIFSLGRNIKDIINTKKIPKQVELYESVSQKQLLTYVDLFITHCGGNSANEAIDYEVPMVCIPLMFDQHECAERIHSLGLGIAFQHTPDKRTIAIDMEADIYFRDSLTEENLENEINTILNTSSFKENIKKIKADNATLSFTAIMDVLNRSRNNIHKGVL